MEQVLYYVLFYLIIALLLALLVARCDVTAEAVYWSLLGLGYSMLFALAVMLYFNRRG